MAVTDSNYLFLTGTFVFWIFFALPHANSEDCTAFAGSSGTPETSRYQNDTSCRNYTSISPEGNFNSSETSQNKIANELKNLDYNQTIQDRDKSEVQGTSAQKQQELKVYQDPDPKIFENEEITTENTVLKKSATVTPNNTTVPVKNETVTSMKYKINDMEKLSNESSKESSKINESLVEEKYLENNKGSSNQDLSPDKPDFNNTVLLKKILSSERVIKIFKSVLQEMNFTIEIDHDTQETSLPAKRRNDGWDTSVKNPPLKFPKEVLGQYRRSNEDEEHSKNFGDDRWAMNGKNPPRRFHEETSTVSMRRHHYMDKILEREREENYGNVYKRKDFRGRFSYNDAPFESPSDTFKSFEQQQDADGVGRLETAWKNAEEAEAEWSVNGAESFRQMSEPYGKTRAIYLTPMESYPRIFRSIDDSADPLDRRIWKGDEASEY